MTLVKDQQARERIMAEQRSAAVLAGVAKDELERLSSMAMWDALSPGALEAFRIAYVAARATAEALAIILRYAPDPKRVPFVELARLIRGEAAQALADAEVSTWHDRAPRNDLELHEWLGLTQEEYGRWVTKPDELDKILDERHGPS